MTRKLALGLAVTGAALLIWSAIIHLYLYNDYFWQVRTIGTLFIVQGVSAIALAAAILLFRSAWLALLGALLLVGTAIGLLLSVWIGLFNYQEHLAAPYVGMSLVVEFVGAAVLAMAAALLPRRGIRRSRWSSSRPRRPLLRAR